MRNQSIAFRAPEELVERLNELSQLWPMITGEKQPSSSELAREIVKKTSEGMVEAFGLLSTPELTRYHLGRLRQKREVGAPLTRGEWLALLALAQHAYRLTGREHVSRPHAHASIAALKSLIPHMDRDQLSHVKAHLALWCVATVPIDADVEYLVGQCDAIQSSHEPLYSAQGLAFATALHDAVHNLEVQDRVVHDALVPVGGRVFELAARGYRYLYKLPYLVPGDQAGIDAVTESVKVSSGRWALRVSHNSFALQGMLELAASPGIVLSRSLSHNSLDDLMHVVEYEGQGDRFKLARLPFNSSEIWLSDQGTYRFALDRDSHSELVQLMSELTTHGALADNYQASRLIHGAV